MQAATTRPDPDGRFRLDLAVADLYAHRQPAPLLRSLLVHTRGLLDTATGHVSIVDRRRGRCTRVAESCLPRRIGCRVPLDAGAAGQVFVRRRSVVVDDGVELDGGHPTHHHAPGGATVAVPLWWQGEVVGVNLATAEGRRRFTGQELADVELLTQSAIPALVRASGADPLLDRLFGRYAVDRDGNEPAQRAAVGGGWPAPGEACPLTRREEQVLALVAAGLSDREVAARLVISPKTVHKHVGAVLRKSGAASRTAAVVHALEHGWLPPDGGQAGDGQSSPYRGASVRI